MVKTEEIFIKGSKNKETICDIFLYEPENIEEAALGSLYVVAEMTANEDSLHLINLLTSIIKREYYSLPHRGSAESLEAGLKKANAALNEVATQGNLKWLGKTHFICAALNKEKELFLAQTGLAQAHLCREGQLVGITKKIASLNSKPHPAKTFQNIIAGEVMPADRLFFGTPAIFEILSLPGLDQLLNSVSLATAADQINRLLREERRPSPMSALLLEIVKEDLPLSTASSAKQRSATPPINLEEILK
ncbi:MAG: PP2C family serine/threonine-protein phosphatase [Patescibacteria group bacterium]